MTTLFQVGVLPLFLEGIYEGDTSFQTLAQKGDCGLGVLNQLNGEMVAVDGVFYRIASDGTASLVSPNDHTPFALVSQFKPQIKQNIQKKLNLNQLNSLLETLLPTQNIFYMIRIDAELTAIRLRSESCQTPPKGPLASILPKIQNTFEINQASKGALIATYAPLYSASVTIPGFHYHYIDDAREIGGHVFDLTLTSAQINIQPIRDFQIQLPKTAAFDNTSPTTDLMSALNLVEKG